jgi:2-octaprenyl-6-methoxyphenol hydroxylase
MKVCILGNGLTSFTLAKALVNLGIKVDIFTSDKIKIISKSRTLGLSSSNIEFFNKNILNIEKLLWDIKKIEIFTENLKNDKILDFSDNDRRIFSLIKNSELLKKLRSTLIKDKLFRLKKKVSINPLLEKDYNLIFNCEINNLITKKFFYRKFSKDYKSFAHTGIIKHQKIENNVATQIFTKKGPLAFLPISENQTSIVFSVRGSKKESLKKLINQYNKKFKIKDLENINSFELKSFNLRTYYHKNILAFGDLLHKIHPLAGQGFNMSLRDIQEIIALIKSRISLGLDLDNSIFYDFEKKVKHNNFIFSNGIDFIYEFFKLESNFQKDFLSKSIKFLSHNKKLNKLIMKYADTGRIV